MGAYGADPQSLKKLATQLKNGADTLEHLSTSLTSSLTAAPWKGGDADTYRSTWHGTSAAQIRAAVEQLQKASDDLNRNAEEQIKTSAADGGSFPVSGVGSGTTESPGAILKDLEKDVLTGKGLGSDLWKLKGLVGGVNKFRNVESALASGDLDALKEALGSKAVKSIEAEATESGRTVESLLGRAGADIKDLGMSRYLGDLNNPFVKLAGGTVSKVFGGLGVLGTGYSLYNAFKPGESVEGRITNGLSGLGGLAVAAPTVAGVLGGGALFAEGGALALVPGVGEVAIAGVAAYEVGKFAYEHREQIEHGLEDAGHAVNTAYDATAHALGSAASSTEHALSGAVSSVSHYIPHVSIGGIHL